MLKFYQRLGFKISLILSLVSIPILALTAWRVIEYETATVEDLTIEKGKTAAVAGARAYGIILENGVRAKEISMDDLMNPVYTEIQFPGISVENKRFHTAFDSYCDNHGIQAIEDAILSSSADLIYAVGSDKGAYVPVTHSEYSEPPTGNIDHDRAKSRSKRRFNRPDKDAMQLKASAYLEKDPLIQEYHRDTGDLTWDVSVPIWVNGQHFGGFRVGVRKDQIAAHKKDLAISLAGQFGILAAFLVGFIFLRIHFSMKPLNKLVATAKELSMGDNLSKKIEPTSTDEVGSMAKALDLVRRGLRDALIRIG